MLPGISGGEIIIILLVTLLLFGSKSLPRVAKNIGKAMHEFKKAASDIKREIDDSLKS